MSPATKFNLEKGGNEDHALETNGGKTFSWFLSKMSSVKLTQFFKLIEAVYRWVILHDVIHLSLLHVTDACQQKIRWTDNMIEFLNVLPVNFKKQNECGKKQLFFEHESAIRL